MGEIPVPIPMREVPVPSLTGESAWRGGIAEQTADFSDIAFAFRRAHQCPA
jgi:hypothetical protein